MSADPAKRPPDPYQAKYMAAGDGALLHHKMAAPWWFHLMFLLPVVFVWIVYAIGGSKPAPLAVPLLLTPLFVLIWLLFAVLRVTVTKSAVVVQYGLFGPTIPLESIVSAEEIDYDWTKTSYGIHIGPDGSWVYNMFGDGAHGVKIVYDQGGKRKSVIVGTKGAAEIAAAIAKGRGTVRVADEALATEPTQEATASDESTGESDEAAGKTAGS